MKPVILKKLLKNVEIDLTKNFYKTFLKKSRNENEKQKKNTLHQNWNGNRIFNLMECR